MKAPSSFRYEHSSHHERGSTEHAHHPHERYRPNLETKSAPKDQQEVSPEHTTQLQEALKLARDHDERHVRSETVADKETRRTPLDKRELTAGFNQTMNEIREDMDPADKAFSTFIHVEPIEYMSDTLSSTLVRPLAMLWGVIGGCILTLVVYIFSKHMGYPMSGFEPIAAFLVGWTFGLAFEYVRALVSRKR